jgi:hypothetical protein
MRLSKAVKIYECVGESTAVKLKISDILVDTIAAPHIRFYATDNTGRGSILLLSDVSGDAYTYGFIKGGTVTSGAGSLSVTNPTTSVTNGDGTTAAVIGTTNLSSRTPRHCLDR